MSGTLNAFLNLNLTVISSNDSDNNSKSSLLILILENKHHVSAMILLDIKSIFPLKIVLKLFEIFASTGNPFFIYCAYLSGIFIL